MGPSVVAGEQPSAVMPHGMSALGCLPAQEWCGAVRRLRSRRRGFGGGGLRRPSAFAHRRRARPAAGAFSRPTPTRLPLFEIAPEDMIEAATRAESKDNT
jgi:hypothetical protein